MAHPRNLRVNIPGSNDFLLVILMNNGLFCHHKTGPYLHRFRPQHPGRRKASAIPDAAGGNDRNLYRIHHLGHQCHGGQLTDMSS